MVTLRSGRRYADAPGIGRPRPGRRARPRSHPEDLRWLRTRARDSAMKIYVGNLSYNTSEACLNQAFEAHGPVQSANLPMDRDTGRPRGFGFIEMGDDDARKAIEALNGTELDGRQITVNEARPRENRSGSFGGGGGGNRGGGGRRW
ncbi:MAG: RNA-binding protein [Phycisphaeraceae bacterium]|nr:RNA-binding protein [Phycisphaeraceae bacterium]